MKKLWRSLGHSVLGIITKATLTSLLLTVVIAIVNGVGASAARFIKTGLGEADNNQIAMAIVWFVAIMVVSLAVIGKATPTSGSSSPRE